MGLQSAPEMAGEFGGPDLDTEVQADIEAVGQRVRRVTLNAKAPAPTSLP